MRARDVQARKFATMEGWLARWYAHTRGHDMADFRAQAHKVAQRLSPGADVLEVAPGPGYFAIELARLGAFRIVGLDISRSFVAIATDYAQRAGVVVDFRHGDVSAMPFADQSFDFVYCSAAFKNFAEPIKALDEMHRVLRPGGEALIVDLRNDAPIQEIDKYLHASGRAGFDLWFTRLTFRQLLCRRAYPQETFRALAGQSAFDGCTINPGPIGFEALFTKCSEN
jgi:ubiquinone/menaquinone biosynthesis C-methylase UbiE